MYLAFAVGASGVGIELVEGGDARFSAAGQNDEVLRQMVWDLGRLVDKTLTLRLFDGAASSWGHLLLDEIWLLETSD